MTNHWADMSNSTNVIVMGANPVENHPASIAHINKAREGGNGHANASMIVIDPRKTRTALQADNYVRMRPGTDIAVINGLVRYIINWMETHPSDPKSVNFFAYLNQGGAGEATQIFYSNTNGGGGASATTATKFGSKYTDARFIINSDGTDYDRENVKTTGDPLDGSESPATTIYGLPKKATTVTGNPNTVYNRLKAHVAPYTPAVVQEVSGISEAELALIAMSYINNSRCASFDPAAPTTIINNPTSPYYRATTMLYAMGITQHTCGAQNVKSFATLQTLMGNFGRAGGGINALRGIHNVQGSTDMGLLYGNIIAYSGNPTLAQQPSNDTNGFGKYMDALWGYPLSGSGNRANMDGSYHDAYNPGARMWLQQQGFYNMTLKLFGTPDGMAGTETDKSKMDAIFSLWPKGNGDDHRIMFRKMITGETKALVAWGQNPAVTEPNQSAIRAGMENLDLLVVVDMFETETAAVNRKDDGVTYLIPSAAHVEVGGSATNSGRTLQWRYQARKPAGNSKSDLELFFRLAYALDQPAANAFSHIKAVWNGAGSVTHTSVYDELYGSQYADGWNPTSATAFEALSGNAEYVAQVDGVSTVVAGGKTITGTEWVSEKIYREMCLPCTSAAGGSVWIYTGAYNTDPAANKHTGQANWATANRAKSRDKSDPNSTFAYPGWGYAWLVNRRVLYNNGEVPGDVADFPMGPDACARLFVSTNSSVIGYSRFYRTIHKLVDMPKKADGTTPAVHVLPGRFPSHTEPYETPYADWEKWGKNSKGTGYLDLLPVVSGSPATAVGDSSDYPLVLTTIRCVEHFQGGPITRNNAWNVEVEPEPWVEIHSADARKYSIKDGDWVNIITARGDSVNQDLIGGTTGSGGTDNFNRGFKARVGVGVDDNQRVGKGVVAIPWHWGDAGLSTGSRANDLCIDAGDANTTIPESKACLCKIEKA